MEEEKEEDDNYDDDNEEADDTDGGEYDVENDIRNVGSVAHPKIKAERKPVNRNTES